MNLPVSKSILSPIFALPLLVGSLSAEEIPLGRITAEEQFVLANTHANYTWEIGYPVETDENGNPTQDTMMEIRLLGSAMGQAAITLNTTLNGTPTQLYSGHGEAHPDYQLTPGTVAASVFVEGGSQVEFQLDMWLNNEVHNQVAMNNGWVSTERPDQQHMFVQLLDGEEVPTYAESNGQRPLREIIAAYLDEDGKVDIGDDSIIYSFEAWTNDTNDHNFDMQDIVILVTYTQIEISE